MKAERNFQAVVCLLAPFLFRKNRLCGTLSGLFVCLLAPLSRENRLCGTLSGLSVCWHPSFLGKTDCVEPYQVCLSVSWHPSCLGKTDCVEPYQVCLSVCWHPSCLGKTDCVEPYQVCLSVSWHPSCLGKTDCGTLSGLFVCLLAPFLSRENRLCETFSGLFVLGNYASLDQLTGFCHFSMSFQKYFSLIRE